MSQTGRAEGRNLVLGLAEGLGWDQLRPFVASLARTSFDGDVCLFVAGADDETRRALQRAGVRVQTYRRVRIEVAGRVFHAHDPPLRRFRSARITASYPLLLRTLTMPAGSRASALARLAAPISIPSVARFYRAYRHLSSVGSLYSRVLLIDVRDTYFLRDPFSVELGDGLCSFLEADGHTLGSERQNRRWIVQAFGEAALARLATRPICCVGATIGSTRAMLAYLELMVDALSRQRQFWGVDQAVHNDLVHSGRVPDLELVPHGAGPVVHLALVPEDSAEISRLALGGSSTICALHQYDRHPRLASALLSRLGDASGS